MESKKREEEEESKEMKAWEQHSRVISIPRFDYNAPSSLLQHSHSGFLITCTIKREKSATKEAISILQKYFGFFNNDSSTSFGVDGDGKRRKICTEEVGGKRDNVLESINNADELNGLSKDDSWSSVETDKNPITDYVLSLVKLTRSGLLLFTFPREISPETIDIVSNIFQSLESGSLKSPLWCHRIFPIQATCRLNERELRAVVSNIVLRFVNDKQNKLARPIKFAVGYNRRGIEETQMKISNENTVGSELFTLLNRDKCFGVVASAVKDVVSDATVDLKSPELAILVELLPLSGVPKESLVVAVSVLPLNLVSTKPRLCIRALVSNTNARNGRS
ncbi:hypothetical protein CFOL_v3_26456 [Cephalotus follicularis]|uniref:Uncharacterized protein n=1 Tax=Cephalotus follicularis TaxID=3775 RepID=A0A1Q3CS49_CEPFO|nr:hypothetical protein CFOL_v3_26456 [Cephalotus follicularis]